MQALLSALAAGDWPLALDRALAVWREARDPALADLIDRITARCELPAPAGALPVEHQEWWVERGRDHRSTPDALTVAGLLAVLGDRADALDASINAVRQRWQVPRDALTALLGQGNRSTNFSERVAVLLAWPDDPRVAMAVVDVLRTTGAPRALGIEVMCELLADRLAAIGDRRVLDKLAAMAREPRATQEALREAQVALATRAIAGLTRRAASRDVGPQLAACLAILPPPSPPAPPAPHLHLEALWREVAANPEDIGVRAVLGDALVEHGDLRGDVIVLQCHGRQSHRPLRGSNRDAYDGRVKTLLRLQWEAWLGDLALVLPRRACEFRCGMLEVVTVGTSNAPGWAFAKAKGHRELACVHTVRPGWITPEHYAAFVLALPRMPTTLAVTGIDVITLLRDRGASLERVATLELVRSDITIATNRRLSDWTSSPLRDALATLAVIKPELASLVIRDHAIARACLALGRELRMMFPKLHQVALDQPTALALGELAGDPLFTLEDRRLRI